MTTPLLRATDRGVLTLTLNRPAKLNALNADTVGRLIQALCEASTDDSLRCVVITGTGRAFCVGADTSSDLPRFDSLDTAEVALSDEHVPTTSGAVPMLDRGNELAVTLAKVQIPVIAAINGVTVGLGLSLALACDLVVMAASARALLGFSQIGLMPDGGATLTVPTRLGLGRAMGMALLGDSIDAKTAFEAGVANRIFDDETFTAQVHELALSVAAGPTDAFRRTKAAFIHAHRSALADALARETSGQLDLIRSQDLSVPTLRPADRSPNLRIRPSKH